MNAFVSLAVFLGAHKVFAHTASQLSDPVVDSCDALEDVEVSLLQSKIEHKVFALSEVASHQEIRLQAEAAVAAGAARKNEPYREKLNNYDDMQYSATMTVGGQSMEGILDTGSFEVLIFSEDCKTCGKSEFFYNKSQSKTYQHHPSNISTMHSFGSGDAWSDLGYDRITFGDLAIDSQYFWEVTKADMPVLNFHNSFQAIVGVGPITTMKMENHIVAGQAGVMSKGFEWAGFDAKSSELTETRDAALVLTEQKPILENLGVNIFSVCFLRGKGEHGYFIWNDTEPRSEPEKFRELPVIGSVHWGVKLQDVRFEGGVDKVSQSLACDDEKGCAAVIDSGTSLIAVPKETAENTIALLNDMPNASCDDLSSFPTLEFKLAGQTVTLPPEAYIVEMQGKLPAGPFGWIPLPVSMCTLGFITMDMTSNEGPMWIIGMPFFREYYTTFRMGDDPWKQSDRSLFIAKSGEDCNPVEAQTKEPASLLQQKKLPRRVNLEKMTYPTWVTKLWKDSQAGVAEVAL